MADNQISRNEATKSDKLKALDLALSTIEKQFGKGSIMKLGGSESHHRADALDSCRERSR